MNYISIGQKFIKNAQNGLLKLSVKQIYQSDILKLHWNSILKLFSCSQGSIWKIESYFQAKIPTSDFRSPVHRGQAEKFQT